MMIFRPDYNARSCRTKRPQCERDRRLARPRADGNTAFIICFVAITDCRDNGVLKGLRNSSEYVLL